MGLVMEQLKPSDKKKLLTPCELAHDIAGGAKVYKRACHLFCLLCLFQKNHFLKYLTTMR